MPAERSGPRLARFYFHLHNGEVVLDERGTELRDLQAAVAYAVNMARFEVSEAAKLDGRITLSHRIEVADGNGAVLETVRFGDAVTVIA